VWNLLIELATINPKPQNWMKGKTTKSKFNNIPVTSCEFYRVQLLSLPADDLVGFRIGRGIFRKVKHKISNIFVTTCEMWKIKISSLNPAPYLHPYQYYLPKQQYRLSAPCILYTLIPAPYTLSTPPCLPPINITYQNNNILSVIRCRICDVKP